MNSVQLKWHNLATIRRATLDALRHSLNIAISDIESSDDVTCPEWELKIIARDWIRNKVEQYEKLVNQAERMADNPHVQEAT